MGSHALFDSYFRAGHACYVIQEGTAILGYLWVFADSYRMAFGGGNGDEVRLVFSPSVAFVGNVFVNPVRRRQGLYRQLLRGMAIDESRRRGIREVVVVVKASNTVSVCAHQGNGFEITSTVYCISLRVLAFLVAIPAKGRPWLCRITNGRSLAYECLSGSTASERVLPPANSNAKPRER